MDMDRKRRVAGWRMMGSQQTLRTRFGAPVPPNPENVPVLPDPGPEDVRWSKVIRLRTAILSGCYHVSAAILADRLLRAGLLEREFADD